MNLEKAVNSVLSTVPFLTWGVNGKPQKDAQRIATLEHDLYFGLRKTTRPASKVNRQKSNSQELIQPDQTFLDVIKTKLPQHADSIQTGEAVVEAKVSGEFGTLPPTILGLDPPPKSRFLGEFRNCFGVPDKQSDRLERGEGGVLNSPDFHKGTRLPRSRSVGSKRSLAACWKRVIRCFFFNHWGSEQQFSLFQNLFPNSKSKLNVF